MPLAHPKPNRRQVFAAGTAWMAAAHSSAAAKPLQPNPIQQTIAGWHQWGGPDRNFHFPEQSRRTSWNRRSPLQRGWQAELGRGQASVVATDDDVDSVHLDGDAEVLTCRSLRGGSIRWQHRTKIAYHAATAAYDGPHSTPCLAGSSIVSATIDAQVHAVDRVSGKRRWIRNLGQQFGTQLPQSGYAASPLVFDDKVILPTLGVPQEEETEKYRPGSPTAKRGDDESNGLIPGAVALDLATGRTRWRTPHFRSSHASTSVAVIAGKPTLLFHGMFELVGVDPDTGVILWRHLLRPDASDNVAFTPLWSPNDQLVLISHGYCSRGAQAIKISRTGDNWTTRQAWQNPQLRLVHSNGVLAGDTFLGVNSVGAELAVGVDIRTGQTRFRKRCVVANLLVADQRHVLGLDRKGRMFMVRLEANDWDEIWSQEIFDSTCWSPPSILGNRVLSRDDRQLRVDVFGD
ncbi:MAG: PQQ-binding-like beta-propeller repeat protein [Planctomycetota bacterium]